METRVASLSGLFGKSFLEGVSSFFSAQSELTLAPTWGAVVVGQASPTNGGISPDGSADAACGILPTLSCTSVGAKVAPLLGLRQVGGGGW